MTFGSKHGSDPIPSYERAQLLCRCGMPLGHDDDDRFTAGLWIEVLEVLTRRGYQPEALDVQQALFRLLHGPSKE